MTQPFNVVEVKRRGFVSADLDPSLDLVAEIAKLKKEKNAVLLAHYYQDGEIQDIADFVGDSLALAQAAAKTPADMILFAGVHFMAETAKILNPTKKVILPDLNAGCSLSDSCPAPVFREYKKKYPYHKVVMYINCSADLKALSDVIVTSSNAERIVRSFPVDQPIIFGPDKNLGAYLNKVTGRNMLLWDGACMVHEIFERRKIEELKFLHPTVPVIAHPECMEGVLELADFIGSTSALLKFVKESSSRRIIVATEGGIIHQMKQDAPDKELILAGTRTTCACNNCPHMKLNTLEKVYLSLKYELPEIEMEEATLWQARKAIDRMLELS
jgi:quinolinate synthase